MWLFLEEQQVNPESLKEVTVKIADLGSACWVVGERVVVQQLALASWFASTADDFALPRTSTNTSVTRSRPVSIARWRSCWGPTTGLPLTSGALPAW